MARLEKPKLEHAFDMDVAIAPMIEIGATAQGERRVIPILGGVVQGPRLNGKILPTGADFQIVRRDGVAELTARYVIEADDGSLIYIENSGIRHGPPELIERLKRGTPVDPKLIYFRTAPRFETASARYVFLTQHLFVATGARHKDKVEISVWMII